MRSPLIGALAAAISLVAPAWAQPLSLDQACQKFADKLSTAQAAGDAKKAQAVYSEGSKRIASRFQGASCPNVKPPQP